MTTINVSEGAYDQILEEKQKMERLQHKLISISEAVDVLLGVKG